MIDVYKPIRLIFLRGYLGEKYINSFNEIEKQDISSQKYNDWLDRLTQKRIPVGPILDVLDGATLNKIDRRFKKAYGWARQQIIAAIKQY